MKQQILIKQVLEPYKGNNITVYKYTALMEVEEDGQKFQRELEIDTFDLKVAEILKVGWKGEAEIEEKPRKDRKGMNRNIKMIYQDGQALVLKGKGQYPQKDTRDQTAINSITDHIVAVINALAVGVEYESLEKFGLAPSKEMLSRRDAWLLGTLPKSAVSQVKAAGGQVVEQSEADKLWDQMKRDDDIRVPEMKTITEYRSVMNTEFKLNEPEAQKLLAEAAKGRVVGPVVFKDAYLKALAEKKAVK